MQDALRRLYQQGTLTPRDDQELLAFCATAHGVDLQLDIGVTPAPVDHGHVPEQQQASNPVSLVELRNLTHVNAVAAEQKLRFARTGLTIVYGDNGSGKSGYVRVLKRVCRARHCEGKLLPNVYADPPSQAATAEITYASNAQNCQHAWTDGSASTPAELSRISVFDSRCAEVHATGKNELAYTPRTLAVLSELAKAAQRLKEKLKAKEQQLAAARPPWNTANPKPFHDTTAVGTLITGLSASTTAASIEQLSQLSESDVARIDEIKRELGEPPAETLRRLRSLAQRVNEVVALVRSVDEHLSTERIANYRQHLLDLEAKREAARIAVEGRRGDDPLPGVGSETWKTLWEAARAYSEADAHPEQPFPVTGDGARCVLCQQALSSEAGNRLTRFEAFVKDETQRQADAAARVIEADRARLREIDLMPRSIRKCRETIRQAPNGSELAGQVRRYLTAALRRGRQMLSAAASNQLNGLRELGESPLERLSGVSGAFSARIAELSTDAGSVARKALESELYELEDRRWLRDSRQAVEDEIRRITELKKIEAAIGDTSTNRITRRASAIAGALVTNRLRDAFAQEIERLGIGRLRAEMSSLGGSAGDSTYGVTLIRSRNAKVADVFSEGEFRCIALAAFLAELATADEQSGIIFDDPVSSLDHNHRSAVAKRLADVARTRQVVVFTHDLVFLCDLDEAARACNLEPKYQCIARGPDYAGYADSRVPFNRQRPISALQGIESHLSNTKRQFELGQQAEWAQTAKSVAGQIRDCWELAVEDVLKPVLSRFSHKTAPSKLNAVAALDATDAETVREGYGQCSEWAHTSGPAAQAAPPEPDALQAEIERLRNWIAGIETKQAGLR